MAIRRRSPLQPRTWEDFLSDAQAAPQAEDQAGMRPIDYERRRQQQSALTAPETVDWDNPPYVPFPIPYAGGAQYTTLPGAAGAAAAGAPPGSVLPAPPQFSALSLPRYQAPGYGPSPAPQSLTGGDYDALQQALYAQQMDPARREIAAVHAARGTLWGTGRQNDLARASRESALAATMGRYQLQTQEQARLDALAQQEAAARRAWSGYQAEREYGSEVAARQAEMEAQRSGAAATFGAETDVAERAWARVRAVQADLNQWNWGVSQAQQTNLAMWLNYLNETMIATNPVEYGAAFYGQPASPFASALGAASQAGGTILGAYLAGGGQLPGSAPTGPTGLDASGYFIR